MKIEVHTQGGLRKIIDIDPKATWGATIGTNVFNADGSLFVPSAGSSTPGTAVTDWSLITNIPAPVSALAAVSGTGLYTITGAGTSATRTITASAPLTVTNGNGVAGNPALAVTAGDLIAGTNVTLTGTLTGRLLGSGNVTIAASGGGGGANWWFTPPAAADFTLASGDGTNAVLSDDADIGLRVSGNTAAASGIVRYGYKALPASGDWEVSTKLITSNPAVTAIGIGLFAVEAATGKFGAMIVMGNPSDQIQARRGTVVGGYTGDTKLPWRADIFVRLALVGSNIIFSMSYNGKDYFQVASFAQTTVFTTKADRIGIGAFCANASNIARGNCEQWIQSW